MIKAKKEIDLLSYLPNFLREYDETKAALNAENPEFKLLWELSAEALDNSFILTAGEDGIKRFEKLLGILPEPGRDLETRRGIVLARWLSRLPYTYRMLLRRLFELCGDDNFSVQKSFEEEYFIRVVTHMRDWGKTPEARRLLAEMLPANMTSDYYNSITFKAEKNPAVYCGMKVYGKRKKIKVQLAIADRRDQWTVKTL